MTTAVNATYTRSISGTRQVNNSDPTATPVTTLQSMPIPGSSTWNSGLTPNATESWSGHVALVAGVATIDLTSLTQLGMTPAVNATGLKLRVIAVLADSGNAGPIQIGTGAANGFAEIGVWSKIQPGQDRSGTFFGSAVVDGTHKTLDLAGTLTDGMDIMLVFGS